MSKLQSDFTHAEPHEVDPLLILLCKYCSVNVNVQEALAQYKWCLVNPDEADPVDRQELYNFLETIYSELELHKLEV